MRRKDAYVCVCVSLRACVWKKGGDVIVKLVGHFFDGNQQRFNFQYYRFISRIAYTRNECDDDDDVSFSTIILILPLKMQRKN